MKRKQSLFLLLLIGSLLLSGCTKTIDDPKESATHATTETTANTQQSKEDIQQGFDDYMLELFKTEVSNDALTLHYILKDPSAYGIELEEISFGSTEFDYNEQVTQLNEHIDFLKSTKKSQLREDQQITYDVLLASLENTLESCDYYYYSEPLKPTTGTHAQLPILMSEYSFYSKEDIDTYLLLLASVDDYFDGLINFEREKSEKGLFMPEASADLVIKDCQDFVASAENNLLIELFEENLKNVGFELTDEEIAQYIDKNKTIVNENVLPAYQKLGDTIQELKPTCKNNLGLAHLDQGKEYYKILLRQQTGSDKTPEEVIKTLDERRLQISVDLAQVLNNDATLLDDLLAIEDTQFGPEDPQEALELLKQAIQEDFPTAADCDYDVKYVHPSLQDSVSPAFYLTPPIDYYQDNVIYINQSDKYQHMSLFDTLAHEGYPGHLYQITYFLATESAPIRRALSFTGYTEGWASYIQYNSFDYLDIKPGLSDLLRMNTELGHILYCRIDLGIHYEGWTYEDVKNYLASSGIVEEEVVQEVFDTILGMPVSYQSYGLGAIEFIELREYAEQELGDDFNLKEFHQFVLDFGPAPFDVIKDYLQDFID